MDSENQNETVIKRKPNATFLWSGEWLIVEADEKVHIYAGASCLGQGLGTVLVQMVVTNTPLMRDQIVYERSNTWIAPDSGDSSGSRQTLVTGEACRRAFRAAKCSRTTGAMVCTMIATMSIAPFTVSLSSVFILSATMILSMMV